MSQHPTTIRRVLSFTIGALAILLIGQPAVAQLSDQLKGLKKKLPDSDRLVEKITKDEPAITTSLDDVVTEVPFLDGYEPRYPQRLSTNWQDERGRFVLASGSHTFRAESYCLRAGTHESVRGNGYAYAPLKGPQAPIVQAILERSVTHPKVAQQDIQLLLWAIISKARFDDLRPQIQSTAETLLTQAEIRQLSGGALDVVPERALREALRRLPPAARQVLEAEAELRRRLTRATGSFAEAERIAVRAGAAEPEPGGRQIPKGRWSYHPDGYFLRLLPQGYSRTAWEIFVPDELVLERDEAGRIVLLADALGNRIQVEYRGQGPGAGRVLELNELSSLRLVRYDPDRAWGEVQETTWQDRGWVLSGDPRGRIGSKVSVTPADVDERTERASAMLDELLTLESQLGTAGADRDPALAEAIDLAHLRMGLEALIAADSGTPAWASEHVSMVLEAWQFAVCRANGACEAAPPQAAAARPARPEPRIVHAALPGRTDPPRIEPAPLGQRASPGLAANHGRGARPSKFFNSASSVAQPPGGGQRIGQSGREDDLEPVPLTPGYDPDAPEDVDGDGVPNEWDDDIDGDGSLNEDDADMDGDGVDNEDDWDMDGDGRRNDSPYERDRDGDRRRDDEEGYGDPDPCGGYGCCNIPPWSTYPGCKGS